MSSRRLEKRGMTESSEIAQPEGHRRAEAQQEVLGEVTRPEWTCLSCEPTHRNRRLLIWKFW